MFLASLIQPLPARAQGPYDVPRISVLNYYQYNGAVDQKVFAPAPTIHIVAYFWHAFGTITSATITVDGSPYTATVNGTTGNISASIDWDASQAANPSEHTVTVTMMVKPNAYQAAVTYQSDKISQPPPTGPYPSGTVYGDGRVADFVVADIRLKSLKFTGNIGINQDQTTPVPTPEFTWDTASRSLTTPQPACYVQGKNVGFTMTFCDPTGAALAGTATTGYGIKLQANPNGTNAATGQPVPSSTLFDNTTATPISATPFTGSSASVTATTALNSYVARYTTTFSALNIYAEFTHVTPTPTWGIVNSYASPNSTIGNTLYAVVATPTGPMATPWVLVLDYACQWATGSTDATSAATAVCNGFYKNAYYNPNNQPWYTDKTTPETFHLLNFLNKTLGTSSASSGLQGQCNDFSDFLVCLSTSLGAKSLQSQQSNGGFYYSHVIYAGATGTHIPIPDYFYYHQWTTDGSATSGNIFDSAVRPDDAAVTIPVNEALSPYLTWLSPGTSLTAQSPFTPQITN